MGNGHVIGSARCGCLLTLWCATVLCCTSCRPLVGVRATIGEETILERQVLGGRAALAPVRALLPLKPPDRGVDIDIEDIRPLDEVYADQFERLNRLEEQTPETRLWGAIILHNRGVLAARLGRPALAEEQLKESLWLCEHYALDALRWQILYTLGTLKSGERGYALLRRAADALEDTIPFTLREANLEDGGRREELYRRLVEIALVKKKPEESLLYAERRRAVLLARAVGPWRITFPQGELKDLLDQLHRAIARLSDCRNRLCAIPPDTLQTRKSLLPQEEEFAKAREELDTLMQKLREHSPVWGLVVPAPGDVFAAREVLCPDTALLVVEPTAKDTYAFFLVKTDDFRSCRVRIPPALVNRVTTAAVASGGKTDYYLSQFASLVLSPLADALEEPVERIYLAVPRALNGVAWRELPLFEKRLGEQMQVSFLMGLADLVGAFSQKSYGRRSGLACVGWPEEPVETARAMQDMQDVSRFDVSHSDKSALKGVARFHDFVWFSNPAVLRPGAPHESYVAFPGPLKLLNGIGIGELAAWDADVNWAGFRATEGLEWNAESHLPAAVLTRSLIAGGVPSTIYSASGVPDKVSQRFWTRCLELRKEVGTGAAFRSALLTIDRRYRPGFRLYGYLGMNGTEYAQFSRLAFNDLMRQAGSHRKSGRFAEAAAVFLDLWDMAESLEIEASRKPLILAGIQQRLIECWIALKDYERAVTHQRLRIEYLKGYEKLPRSGLAGEYQSLGALLTRAERFEEAIPAYTQAISLLQQEGKEEQVAKVLGELGKSQDRSGEYAEALETFQQVLKKYEALKKEGDVARQLRRIGAIYLRRLNLPHRAEEHFRRALEISRREENTDDVLSAQIDIGLCRRYLGAFEDALGLFEGALEGSRQAGCPRVEARALAEIANTLWLQGKYQHAFGTITQSNAIAGKLDLAFQLNVNHQLLALIWWELNQFARAYAALDEAVVHARRAEKPLEVASAFNNRGIIHRRAGELDLALDSFRQALEIDKALRSRWGQGYDHRNIGLTLHRMKKWEEAGTHLEEAVRICEEIEDRVNLARALFALGDLRLSQGRPKAGEHLLKRALKDARALSLPEVEWRALRALGTLHRRKGETSKALEFFTQGVEVVEGLRGGIKVHEFRSGFLSNKMDIYEDTVSVLLEMGRKEDAFLYAERSRARTFVDILAGQEISLRTPEEQELYGKQRRLATQIRAVTVSLRNERDPKRRQRFSEQLKELQRSYSNVLADIHAANPQLSQFVTIKVPSLEETHALLAPEVTLVVYYLMKDRTAIWVLRNGKLHLRTVPANREALGREVKEFRLMIQNRELVDEVKQRAEKLHSTLLVPISDLIAQSKVLGIVPHGSLHYLSFAALFDGEAFLVEKFPLFYLPSASFMSHAFAGEPEKNREQLEVLVVGNPDVGDPAYELPFTEKEVLSLKRNFVNVTALTRENATEDWVRANAGRFDVVHLGVHGSFEPATPLFSALLLASGPKEDGKLELHEVTGLRLKAHLVTLSACQSGLGTLTSADELVSLSQAFAYAGTRAILSTLWRVDDVSTALVAKHFYRAYVRRGKAVSLRHAQLQVMNDGNHYHPTYWAGMVLTGDYR